MQTNISFRITVVSVKEKQNLLTHTRALLAMLFLYPTQLLLDVHALHLGETGSILRRIWLSVIRQRSLLPASLFFCGYRLTGSTVVYVLTLAGKALEVIRDVGGVDRGGVSSFGLVALFFPARIE